MDHPKFFVAFLFFTAVGVGLAYYMYNSTPVVVVGLARLIFSEHLSYNELTSETPPLVLPSNFSGSDAATSVLSCYSLTEVFMHGLFKAGYSFLGLGLFVADMLSDLKVTLLLYQTNHPIWGNFSLAFLLLQYLFVLWRTSAFLQKTLRSHHCLVSTFPFWGLLFLPVLDILMFFEPLVALSEDSWVARMLFKAAAFGGISLTLAISMTSTNTSTAPIVFIILCVSFCFDAYKTELWNVFWHVFNCLLSHRAVAIIMVMIVVTIINVSDFFVTGCYLCGGSAGVWVSVVFMISAFSLVYAVCCTTEFWNFMRHYRVSRTIYEVGIESLPEWLLQAYIFVQVFSLYTGAEPEFYNFVSLLPVSLVLSTLSLLKAWIDLVRDAEQCGIGIRSRVHHLWQMNAGLPPLRPHELDAEHARALRAKGHVAEELLSVGFEMEALVEGGFSREELLKVAGTFTDERDPGHWICDVIIKAFAICMNITVVGLVIQAATGK